MAKPGETSIWKKEITLRRRPKAEKVRAEEAPGSELRSGNASPTQSRPAPEHTSIWKKEISFRRSSKSEMGDTSPAPSEQEAMAELPSPIASEPLEQVDLPPVSPLAPRPDAPASFPPVTPPTADVPFANMVAPEEPISSEEPIPEEPFFAEPRYGEALPEQSLPDRPVPDAPVPGGPVPPTPVPGMAMPRVPAADARFVEEPPVGATEVVSVAPVGMPAMSEDVVSLPQPAQEIEPEPEKPRSRTRRERRAAKQAAARLAKEQRAEAKRLAAERHKRSKTLTKEAPGLHKQLVGLKIGASQIAAAQVVNKGGPRIVRMARAPLERGVVVGGEVRRPDELAAALKDLFRKNRLPRKRVRLGISNNRIGVRTFEIAGIEDPKQLANAIRFRAQETLPIPLDEAVLDYRILEDRIGEDGVTTHRVLLVVAHRELVDRYVIACRKAGLNLVGIDLEAFALLRALGDPAQPPAVEDSGLVCISIGYDRSTLAVSDGRVCEFTRVLAWGGSALDEALARVLNLEPSEVDALKARLSLAEEGEVAGLDAGLAAEARRAMAGELQAFAHELVASLRFYQEQPGSLGIGEIAITGGTAACGGLAAELERLIGVRVRVADPLARAKVPRKLQKNRDAVGSLAIAVGLGIED